MAAHAQNRYPSQKISDLFNDGFSSEVKEKEPIVNQKSLKVIQALQALKSPEGTFQVGKYSGESYRNIIKDDPSYVRWLITACTSPKFKEDADNLLEILCTEISEAIEVEPKATDASYF